ncbi:hypothetical protein NQ318_013564 [Aromia moschata]|uniref:Uncharacterized protein n=1 Tax=Aromia moschata TaxID=1265417 RepID=A0AAV8Y1D6_9CUCU|nr:hypothetical protein NQ318_013564 [Aromia moschata]
MLKHCPHPELTNSPDNFTPDGRWILGEAPEALESGGLEVVRYLQRLCSNDIDIPVGAIVLLECKMKGGYENDCMLVRQSENR